MHERRCNLGRGRRRRRRRREGDRAGARHRPGLARRRHRDREHLRVDDPGGGAPARAPRRAHRHPVARLRADGGCRLLRPDRRAARVRPRLMTAPLAANPLIEVVPGLMIWTLICFGITFLVLRRYIFGPVQRAIDARRERIRQALQEADNARAEARRLLEEHRSMMQQARGDAEQILAEARRIAESQKERLRDELEADRQRRLEETTKQIQAETRNALEQIRAEVADLTLEATRKVTGKVLTDADHRRLIEDAISELDFSVLEEGART